LPVEVSLLEVPSRWGRPAIYQYRHHTDGSGRLAVIFPGYGYRLDAPLLWYAARAAADAGCDVLGVEYGFQANRAQMPMKELPQAVEEAAGALAGFFADHPYREVLVIAKSIGTRIATRIAEAGGLAAVASVYLTPLRATIEFMRRARRMTVVVGDRDDLFGPEDIARIAGVPGLDLHVIAGVGHDLEVEGDLARSIAILGEVADLCGAACAAR
jgi:predicted alpha/beta-hydrolase family hydrolase